MEDFIDMVLNVDRTEFKCCSGSGLYNSFISCFGMSLSIVVVVVWLLSCVQLFVTPWTVVHPAPGFSW